MKRKIFGVLFALVLALGFSLAMAVPAMSQTTIYVDVSNAGDLLEDGSAAHPFDKIQEGINAAVSGDTINVAAGTYSENLTITKALTLKGEGKDLVTLNPTTTAYAIGVSGGGSNVTIENLTISAGSATNFLVHVSHVSNFCIQNVRVVGAGKTVEPGGLPLGGIDLNTVTTATILNVEVQDVSRNGLALKNSTNVTIESANIHDTGVSVGWAGVAVYTEVGTTSSATFAGTSTITNTPMGIYVEDYPGATVNLSLSSGITLSGQTMAPIVRLGSGTVLGLEATGTTASFAEGLGLIARLTAPGSAPPYNLGASFFYTVNDALAAAVDDGHYQPNTAVPRDVIPYTVVYALNLDEFFVGPGMKIQEGINAAVSGDTVQVAAGTYTEHITLKDGVEVLGAGAGSSIIDGTNSGRVVYANGMGSGTKLDGFTITNGNTTYGGGMYNISSSSLTVSNCTFENNSATLYGGGMCNWISTVTVTDCDFTDNLVYHDYNDTYGGGMCNYFSDATVSGGTFSGNSATSFYAHSYGGGMYNTSNSSSTFTGCTFSGNLADYGGGMFNLNSSPDVTGCTFDTNSATYSGGGMLNDSSSPTLTGCDFTGNSASHGGGMFNTNSSSPTVTDCDFLSNPATNEGGGMCNYNASSPTVHECAFSGNTATSGGGIYASATSATNATGNWWGHATGADHSSNPHGTGGGGDTVSNFVTFIPWYGTTTTTLVTEYVDVVHASVTIAHSDTIQGGIDAVAPGGTVNVHSGTYLEKNITINKSLTVQSTSSDHWRDTIIDLPPNGFYIGPNFGGDAIISGFTICNSGNGIYIDGLDGGSVDISNCLIYNNQTGIYGAGTLDGDISINNCIIAQNGVPTGIHLENVVGTAVITNSFIGAYWDAVEGDPYLGNAGDGIAIDTISETGSVLIDGNIITHNGGNGIADAIFGCYGHLTIKNNVIGAYDYDLTSDDGYFNGNGGNGIFIDYVGGDGVVDIETNRIAQNGEDGICFGGDDTVWGDVTIDDNNIGAWTDYETVDDTVYIRKYGGNASEGIYAHSIASSGSMAITDNKIAENWRGIYIESTTGDTTVSGNNYVGSWTQNVPGVDVDTQFDEPGPWSVETVFGEGTVTHNGNSGPGIYVWNVPDGSLLIQGNNVSKNADRGIYVQDNDSGVGKVTIDTNTVDDNGTGGNGIELSSIDYATISGNTITRHREGDMWLAGVGLYASSYNTITNNTITDNYIGVYIDSNSDENSVVNNVISDNALDGINIDGDDNEILGNTISGNTGAAPIDGVGCGIYLGSDAEDNVINFNNITDNTFGGSVGVHNGNGEEDVDARWNWWGDASGPSGEGPGTGDAVSEHVNYDPWLSALVIDFVRQTGAGGEVDGTDEVDTWVYITGGTADVSIAKYGSNPGSGFSGDTGKYVDVMIQNLIGVTEIEIRLYYTNAEVSAAGVVESSLALRWWDGANWVVCSDSGVNTTDIPAPPPAGVPYSGYMWAKIRNDTTPNLTQLTGTPFGGSGVAALSGGGGPPPSTLSKVGSVSLLQYIDWQGRTRIKIILRSDDSVLTIIIFSATLVHNAGGNPLENMGIVTLSTPPPPPGYVLVGHAYDCLPGGANFAPKVTMTFAYDPADIPDGVSEGSLVMAYWDGDKWVNLPTAINAAANTATAGVEHFTPFALMTYTGLASFKASNLSIQPLEVQPEETVTITLSVANTGDTEGSYSVVLKINGAKEAEKSIAVAAGSSESVAFSVTREEAGSYSVAVDGLTGSFTVVAPAPTTPPTPPAPPEAKPPINWMWIGIIAAVVVVGLIIFFAVRRRAY